MAEPTVRVSGIVLSSLMFHHVNSDSDVEGLLLGEIRSEEQVTISDSQVDHILIEEIYNVQKHITCPKLSSFYNSVCEVDRASVEQLLKDEQQVIGWYRQRRNSCPRVSFREKLLHHHLQETLSNQQLLFLLLTPGSAAACAPTHRTEYTAFMTHSGRFQSVPVLINNLGSLEQLSYWKVSSLCSAAGYSRTTSKHSGRFFAANGFLKEVKEVNDMNESLQEELQAACRGVEQSERQVETLQREVSSLRRKLKEEEEKRRSKDVAPPAAQRNNLLLHEAVRRLFTCSSLFTCDTLTLDGFPAPPHVAMETEHKQETQEIPVVSLLRLEGMRSRRRVKEVQIGRERKRRR